MIIQNRKRMPSILSIMGEDEGGSEKGPDVGELEQCAHELVEAVHSRNVKDVVSAFKAMFTCCESEPHEEYED